MAVSRNRHISMFTVYFAGVVLALAFLLHCAVVGAALMRGMKAEGSHCNTGLHLFFSLCLGMAVNMLALTVLGLAGQFTLSVIAGVAAALVVVGLAGLTLGRYPSGGQALPRLLPRHLMAGSPARAPEWCALIVFLLLCVAVSLHPPGHWDDTMYQLPLARVYVDHHAIVLAEHLRFPLFPQNLNMLFALGLLLGDTMQPQAGDLWQFGAAEVFAQIFATLPLFVMALGLWAASHHYMNSSIPGLLAGLALFVISPVKRTLGFAYVDNGLALFCLAATLAVACAAGGVVQPGAIPSGALASRAVPPRAGPSNAWLLAGLLAGAACGIKYFGVVFSTILGVVVVVAAALQAGRYRVAASVRAAVFYGAGVLVMGGIWYVRSYLVSGDPAHPAGATVFGFFLWDQGDLAWQHAEQALHGVARNPLVLPRALLEAGVLLWLPAIAGLFIRKLPMGLRLLQAVFLAYLAFWFFVTQVPRYLAPIYGVGCFLAMHALWYGWHWVAPRIAGRRRTGRSPRPCAWPWAARVGPAALVLLVALVYASERGAKFGREFLQSDAVLATNSGYPLYQQANAHAAQWGRRLVQVGFEDGVYFFKGTVIGDWFGPGRYRDILQCTQPPCPLPGPQQLRATLHAHGAQMLLLNRQMVTGLNEVAFTAAGWQVIAANEHGVLLAAP